MKFDRVATIDGTHEDNYLCANTIFKSMHGILILLCTIGWKVCNQPKESELT